MIEPIHDSHEQTDTWQGLTERQQRALTALLSHSTIRDAARASNVSEASIYRYKADPTFADALKTAQREQMQTAVGMLQAGTADALAALRDVFEDPSKPATARTSAASKWAGYALQTYYDHSDTAELIERLQQAIDDLERAD